MSVTLLSRSLGVRSALVVAVAFLWTASPTTARAQSGVIELYSSNGGYGRIVGRSNDAPKDINFTFSTGEARNFRNDEARSAIL